MQSPTSQTKYDARTPSNPAEPVIDALTGQDPPIEKAHPGLQPSLVFMSYPIVLVISVIAILSWYWLSAPNPQDKGPAEPTVNRSTTDAEAKSRQSP